MSSGRLHPAFPFQPSTLESRSDLESAAGPLIVLKRHSREAVPFVIGKPERSIGIASKGEARMLRSVDWPVTWRSVSRYRLPALPATTKPFRSVEDFWLAAGVLAHVEDKYGQSVSSAFHGPKCGALTVACGRRARFAYI